MAKSQEHVPTDETRLIVKLSSALGHNLKRVAERIGISNKTLHKYYQHEIDHGKEELEAELAQGLFQKALNGDNASVFFALKTKFRWRETHHIDNTSSDGTMSPHQGDTNINVGMLPDEVLDAIMGAMDEQEKTSKLN